MVAEESSLNAPDESTEYIHSQEDDLTKISIPLFGELAIKLAVATLAELAHPIVGPSDPLNPDIFLGARRNHRVQPLADQRR